MSGAEASESTEGQGGISNQLATLVPTFDPSKDELLEYQQKVELLLLAWPQNKIKELVTRLVLNSKGSAFQKLQLHQTELLTGEAKSVHRLIELLGGHWGKIGLERKFEDAERALFQTVQKSDEANDSYLARADILWARLMSRKMKIEELQAYILLRGSLLTPEEKKKVIIDSDNSLDGELTIKRVSDSIRMLGAGFFHEITGQKRNQSVKIYDQSVLLTQDTQDSEVTLAAQGTSENFEEIYTEEDFVDHMCQEEDQDAVFVADFESAASEVLQSDPELSGAFSAYTEARKRLSDKFKNRGFWPTSGATWKSSGGKGKTKTKGKFGKSRKTLQEKILSSYCKACGRKGHWKAECPYRSADGGQSGGGAVSSQMAAPASVVTTQEPGGLPLEFFQVPQQQLTTLDASRPLCEFSFGTVSCLGHQGLDIAKRRMHASFCEVMKQKGENQGSHLSEVRNEKALNLPPTSSFLSRREIPSMQQMSNTALTSQILENSQVKGQSEDWMLFATHGTYGVVDSGATKTVIGSSFVAELLQGLVPDVRKQVSRCSCNITFRFGNHGTLTSKHALIVPVGSLQLKIAIVDGNTPFLLSNTLLRALKAKVDCEFDRIVSSQLQKPIPWTLTSRGLYLADLNDLVLLAKKNDLTTTTFVTDTSEVENPIQAEVPGSQSEQQNIVVLELESEPSKMQSLSSAAEIFETHHVLKSERLSVSDCQHSEANLNQDVNPKPLTEIEKPEIPSSFRDHVLQQDRPCGPSSTGAELEAQASADSGNPRHGNGGLLGSSSAVRQHSQGQTLCGGLAGRTGMGDVVHQPLQEQPEVRASTFSEICGTDSGEPRVDSRPSHGRNIEPTSNESETSDSSSKEPGLAEVGDSQGQGKSSYVSVPDPRSWAFGGRLQHARDRRHGATTRDIQLSDYDGRGADALTRARIQRGDYAESDAQSGSSDAAGDRALAAEFRSHSELGKPWPVDPIQHALTAGEIDPPFEKLEPSPEQTHLRKLIIQITQEFDEVKRIQNLQTQPVDVMEVFCEKQSQFVSTSLESRRESSPTQHWWRRSDDQGGSTSTVPWSVDSEASTPLVLSSVRSMVCLVRIQCQSFHDHVWEDSWTTKRHVRASCPWNCVVQTSVEHG